MSDPIDPRRLAIECFDLAKHAASAAKGMHARGDANGGYYNDGRDSAFEWLAHQLLNENSPFMRKLREVEMLRAQPPRDEIDRPWTREYERNVWHYDGKDGMMLCGIIIAGSPLVMADEFAFAIRKCPTCRRGAP